MWKREYLGQEVAVKVLRKYTNSDLKKITRVSPSGAPSLSSSVLVIILTITPIEVLQGVRNVESSLSSECAAAARSCDDGDTVRDGVGVDAKR